MRRLLLTLCILSMAMYVFGACTPTDPCSPNPCLNGGSCEDVGGTAECTCVGGYEGETCEIPPVADPCADSPPGCVNGTCVDNGGVAECNCEAGYDGELCDNNIDDCASDPCPNGGPCTDGIDGYSCTWYEDADSDDYGNALSTTTAPTTPPGYVDNDLDCDDTDASVYPGAFELADNIDNDCVNGVDDGISERYIFASSSIHTGDFAQHDLVGGDGLTGADIFCQDLADNSIDLPTGIYKAWLSTSTMNAADRLTHSLFPYVLQDGTVVADSWSALVNTTTTPLQNPINLDENGDAPEGNTYKVAFTGTNGLGEALAETCLDWTSASATGVHGAYQSTTGEKWTVFDGTAIVCYFSSQVYCLQQ